MRTNALFVAGTPRAVVALTPFPTAHPAPGTGGPLDAGLAAASAEAPGGRPRAEAHREQAA